MSKILVLSASPQRDKYIDELFRLKLSKLGHEVWVRPCLRQGRPAVLELQPDIVVLPPIRNPYSRDFAQQLKRWGCGVVTRHTEPSCDMADFKRMTDKQKRDIYGGFPYNVDVELVWGPDEALLLNKRAVSFKAISVGAHVCSIYQSKDIREQLMPKKVLFQKHKLDINKKTILISSPWGFIDAAPDLHIDEIDTVNADTEGRDKYVSMIKKVIGTYENRNNVLVTLHPGVDLDYYRGTLNCPIDTETPAMDLLASSDVLVHSGSTMAIEMHLLNKSAFQYGDVNSQGWWQNSESMISKVSPKAKSEDDIIRMLKQIRAKSNANKATLDDLSKGRYGLLDGKAVDRAAGIINKVKGTFKMCWPESTNDYTQTLIKKQPQQFCVQTACGICGHKFYLPHPEFIKQLAAMTKMTEEQLIPGNSMCCPWCASRFYARPK